MRSLLNSEFLFNFIEKILQKVSSLFFKSSKKLDAKHMSFWAGISKSRQTIEKIGKVWYNIKSKTFLQSQRMKKTIRRLKPPNDYEEGESNENNEKFHKVFNVT